MGFKARRVASSGAATSTPTGLVRFADIYRRAVARKGGPEALQALLPTPKTRAGLAAVPNERYLAAMAKNIFRAGFVWKVIEHKWPGFEEAFRGFDVLTIAGMDERDLDDLAKDTRIIRNRPKIAAVRDNARFIFEVTEQCGGFGRYLADWPEDDLIGLWVELEKRGSRLGGFTRAAFLREVGKDTFMFSADVVRALVAAGIVGKVPTSQRELAATQAAFNAWREETGRPLCELSRILACSVD